MMAYLWRVWTGLALLMIGLGWVVILNFTNIDSTQQRIMIDHWLQVLGIAAVFCLACWVLPSRDDD